MDSHCLTFKRRKESSDALQRALHSAQLLLTNSHEYGVVAGKPNYYSEALCGRFLSRTDNNWLRGPKSWFQTIRVRDKGPAFIDVGAV